MEDPKTAAKLIAAALTLSLAAPVASKADNKKPVNTKPTYIGMTEQDVGVMQRPRPAYDAKGIPFGGFRLFPSLDVSGTYDDNVFKTATAQSDWFFTVSPTLRLTSQWGRNFFEVYGGLNYFDYAKFSDENLTDWKVGTDGRLDITRTANVTANVYYGEFHELWSAPNNVVGFQASPNRYFQTHTEIIGVFQPNRFGIGLGGGYDRYNWINTPKIGGGVLYNDDRDQNALQGYVKLFYDFSPGYSAFVKASYDERDFKLFYDRSGLHRSSHGYRLDGGLDLQITHLVRGEIYLGYLQQSFAHNISASLKNVSGFDYGATLDWFISPVFTAHLSGSRTLSDVVLGGVSVADNKSVALSADYELRPNIILQAHAAYTDSRYAGSTRSDRYPGAGLGVKYLINRYMSLNVGYNYNRRSTDSAALEYTDNTVSVGLTLHL